MDRLACVDVPALPLQLLLRAHPEWGPQPVALVQDERPQSQVLRCNRPARAAGVRPGMRAGTARSLAPALRTGSIEAPALLAASAELLAALRKFSARVEPQADLDRPDPEQLGVFWLDASGLLSLFESLDSWAAQLRAALGAASLQSGVAVGYTRFGTYAVARALMGSRAWVFSSIEAEQRAVARVPLASTGLPPGTLAPLEQLGITRLGPFLRLPAGGVLRRFGAEAHRLRKLAAGEGAPPLQPAPHQEPSICLVELDDAETDRTRLAFHAKQLLDSLLDALAARHQAARELKLSLSCKRAPDKIELLRPAEPTLDAAQLLGLLRLRLESLELPAGASRLSLEADAVPATQEQLELHAQKPKRDLAAAARAFARLRASFGEQAVSRARLEQGHLPEARFSWEPLASLNPAQPAMSSPFQLVRRLRAKPELLPPRDPREPDGWLIRGLSEGRVERLTGPHRISGGWWVNELERDYYFAETSLGECLWIYFDRRRRSWYLQGTVN